MLCKTQPNELRLMHGIIAVHDYKKKQGLFILSETSGQIYKTPLYIHLARSMRSPPSLLLTVFFTNLMLSCTAWRHKPFNVLGFNFNRSYSLLKRFLFLNWYGTPKSLYKLFGTFIFSYALGTVDFQNYFWICVYYFTHGFLLVFKLRWQQKLLSCCCSIIMKLKLNPINYIQDECWIPKSLLNLSEYILLLNTWNINTVYCVEYSKHTVPSKIINSDFQSKVIMPYVCFALMLYTNEVSSPY